MDSQRRPFLTANWRNLVMLTYEIDPEVLQPYVPQGLLLDQWDGKCLISVIGLQFLNIRIRGIPIPLYGSYPEINLRFYVRREIRGQWRRGVVFIKQIVPHRLVALVARWVYHEQFVAMPMQHSVENSPEDGAPRQVSYQWRHLRAWSRMAVNNLTSLQRADPGSVEEFVAEHYWGYNSQPDGSTLEYLVDRPQWRIRNAANSTLECDVGRIYGDEFAESLSGAPISAIWAEGSTVALHQGMKLQ
ncbi:MAG: DUF2071 domain-containing protein [Chloroflexi bacterium]|nr:DUF2071 domain-containing protein [Chloroflexota bacterium]